MGDSGTVTWRRTLVNPQTRTARLAIGALGVTLLVIAPASAAPGPAPGTQASPPARAPMARENAPVSLHLQDTPLRSALQALFAGTGLQHAVSPEVPNYPITLDVRDVPFASTLRTLVRLAPGVTFRKEGEIYIVGMRPPTVTEPTASYPEPPAPVDVAASGGEEWVKIPLNYLHPAVAAYVLNGRLVPNEVDLQTGLGGAGGFGGGFSGQGGNGFSGGLNGGGLAASGGGGLGYGGANGYGQFPGAATGLPGSVNGLGLGNGTGYGTPLVGNGAVVVGPQGRRF
jgi:hypothetical protein